MLTLQVDSLDTRLSRLLNISKTQAKNTIELLESGASVPFIARYRKELTGSLDDTILREFAQKLTYVKELDERRATILNSILEQGKLTLELEKLINEIDNKTVLEDVYLPYKPKRQVKSKIAKDAGLEPYVLNLLASVCNNQLFDMHKEANQYLNVEHNILNTDNVIDGAKFILIDMFAENMEVLSYIRNKIYSEGYFTSTVIEDKKLEAAKFTDYFNYSELIKTIPSHRVLACLRGLNEKLLKVKIELADLDDCYDFILTVFNINNSNGEAYEFLLTCMKLAFRSKIQTKTCK